MKVIRSIWYNKGAKPNLYRADFALKEGETRYLGWVYLTQKHHYGPVSMVLHWEAGEEEPWYLATDQAVTWRTIRTYKVRMWTEEMHGDMKDMALISNRHIRKIQTGCRGWSSVCAWSTSG